MCGKSIGGKKGKMCHRTKSNIFFRSACVVLGWRWDLEDRLCFYERRWICWPLVTFPSAFDVSKRNDRREIAIHLKSSDCPQAIFSAFSERIREHGCFTDSRPGVHSL